MSLFLWDVKQKYRGSSTLFFGFRFNYNNKSVDLDMRNFVSRFITNIPKTLHILHKILFVRHKKYDDDVKP